MKVRTFFAALAILGTTQTSGLSLAAGTGPSMDENQRYLSANAHKPGVIVKPSGLQYRILRSGFGRHPTAADTVEASYSGYLVNGTLVDHASTDLPATIPVSTALRGLSEAL